MYGYRCWVRNEVIHHFMWEIIAFGLLMLYTCSNFVCLANRSQFFFQVWAVHDFTQGVVVVLKLPR